MVGRADKLAAADGAKKPRRVCWSRCIGRGGNPRRDEQQSEECEDSYIIQMEKELINKRKTDVVVSDYSLLLTTRREKKHAFMSGTGEEEKMTG